MKKFIGIIIILLALGMLAVYWFSDKTRVVPVEGCDQSATTTDCAKLVKDFPAPGPMPATELKETIWRKYSNDKLGISLSYPTKKITPEDWGIGPGDTGEAFQITIPLPSGAVIYGYAFSPDYTVGKDGPGVGPEGYVVQNGKYYVLNHGEPSPIPFTPDEILKLSNGGDATLIYGKNFDPHADYPDPAVIAMVNIPKSSSKTFTGIGFVLYNLDNNGSQPATEGDIAIFKKVISSIEFK